MAFDALKNALETFSAPLESVIAALGQGIAQAQQALDRNSIQTQETIDADPLLSQYGLQATWYQFPKVDLQLTMSLAVAEEQTTTQETSSSSGASPPAPLGATGVSGASMVSAFRLVAQPVSASFQSHFNYSGQAASQITLAIVPVPAPRAGDQVTLPPKLQPADVQQLVLASGAKFITAKDQQGNTIFATVDSQSPPNALRTDINFNASSRTWYVLQYAPANKNVVPVVVAVDDASKAVRVISSP
jgi:hypothetical protein